MFANPAQRHIVDTTYTDFGPRLGLAYQMRSKLVLRAGYGLFYNPTQCGTTGAGPVGNEGFQATTGYLDDDQSDGLTPWGRVSNPYPNGLLCPPGLRSATRPTSASALPNRYATPTSPPTRRPGARVSNTNFPGAGWLTPTTSAPAALTCTSTAPARCSTWGPGWNRKATPTGPALRTALGTYVANPYAGVINTPGCGICGPTIEAGNLLQPFPQFNGVAEPNPAVANSIYNAFQLKVEKRMSKGLSVMASYTNSKSIDDASVSTSTTWIGGFSSFRDPNSYKVERSLSEWDIPQVLQFSYIWQVPFGRGKKWGSGLNSIVDGFLGGWQTSGMWRFDNGQPISIGVTGATAPQGYGTTYPDMIGRLRTFPKSMWFKTNPITGSEYGYFSNASSALEVPAPYTIGNAPREQPNVRQPGTKNATLAIFKDIPLNKMREGSRLQIRAEAFNALNHPQFGGTNGIATTFGTGSFGNVDSQANSPRQIQMGLQLYF